MVRGNKSERFQLRIAPEEIAMLNRISEETGLSMSDVIRQAIRRWHAEIEAAKPRKKR